MKNHVKIFLTAIFISVSIIVMADVKTVTCAFTVSEIVCINQEVKVVYTNISASPVMPEFFWNFGEAKVLSGSGQGPFVLSWPTAGTKHIYLKVKLGNDSCSNTRTIIVKELPKAFQMTGGGSYASGGTGVEVGLNGSTDSVIYTLYRNDVFTGITVKGTGSAISFGKMKEPGTYICKANTEGSQCFLIMEGKAIVSITSGSTLCDFVVPEIVCKGQDVKVVYTGKAIGISIVLYFWNFGGAKVVSGSGPGPYVVHWDIAGTKEISLKVKVGADSCFNTRKVLVRESPEVFQLSGGGSYPAGGDGVEVGLSGSEVGVLYFLNRIEMSNIGIVVKGTGSPLSFGKIKEPGTYICKARIEGSDCASLMDSKAVVSITGSTASCSFTVSEVVCPEQDIKLVYIGSVTGTASAKFFWDFGDARVISGTGQGPYVLHWLAPGIKQITLKVISGIDSCTNTRKVLVKELHKVLQLIGSGSNPADGTGIEIGLNGSEPGVIYELYRNEIFTGISIKGTGSPISFGRQKEPGTYYCKARVDGSECFRLMGNKLVVGISTNDFGSQLCMVTFDTVSSHNMLIWTKTTTTTINHYNIYKETSVNNVFEKLAEVPFVAPSFWVDENSEPLVKSDRYRISVTDVNNVESGKSPAHKTIHLSISLAVGGYNLMWNHYEGFEYQTYRIFRRMGHEPFILLASVAANVNSYSDFVSATNEVEYYIQALKKEPCIVSLKSGSFEGVSSNKVSSVPFGTIEQGIRNLTVSPNPVKDLLAVSIPGTKSLKTSYILYSANGAKLISDIFYGNKGSINFSVYRDGFYFLVIRNEEGQSVVKLLKR